MRLPNGYGGVIKLTGRRRRPYAARITTGWSEEKDGTRKQRYHIIGYAETRAEALNMLAAYNQNPIDVSIRKLTFKDIYDRWSKEKFPTVSSANIYCYKAAYKLCSPIENQVFINLRLDDLQRIVDESGKNYPSLRKLKVLLNQLYDYAMKHELCTKDYSDYVDIAKHRNKNPNKYKRDKFSDAEIATIWKHADDEYYQTILMLLYSGVRVSELLNLKKEDVHLEEQCFDVIASKTENGIRTVPIADKTLPFFKYWYNKPSLSPYLINSENGIHLSYRNYYQHYFKPRMEETHISRTPHCTRHTCISLLARANVNQTIIKLIVGHAGAMSLTEKVYTHLDTSQLVDAINKI